MADSQVLNFEKAKILISEVRVLETVSNAAEKLSESCQFEKTRDLSHRKQKYCIQLLIKFSVNSKWLKNANFGLGAGRDLL